MNRPLPAGLRITIIGNRGGTNIGEAFERAAVDLGIDVQMIEHKEAMAAPAWLRRINWYFRGRRPTRLDQFSIATVESCLNRDCQAVVITGSGLNSNGLRKLCTAGVKVVNYLTDDPFNPAHRAPWFLRTLPEYFALFSPRHANISNLRELGCGRVTYLPFGYDPHLHFPECVTERERETLASDLLFVGGADTDRIPICGAIANSGLKLALYGDYWDRSSATRPFWKGYADLPTLRKATRAAKVCLSLVRRANRDGHTMRSYEIPAMGGVTLAEATDDHMNLYGEEGALYFQDTADMIEKATWLMAHRADAMEMAARAHDRVINGHNSYADRLKTILSACFTQ